MVKKNGINLSSGKRKDSGNGVAKSQTKITAAPITKFIQSTLRGKKLTNEELEAIKKQKAKEEKKKKNISEYSVPAKHLQDNSQLDFSSQSLSQSLSSLVRDKWKKLRGTPAWSDTRVIFEEKKDEYGNDVFLKSKDIEFPIHWKRSPVDFSKYCEPGYIPPTPVVTRSEADGTERKSWDDLLVEEYEEEMERKEQEMNERDIETRRQKGKSGAQIASNNDESEHYRSMLMGSGEIGAKSNETQRNAKKEKRSSDIIVNGSKEDIDAMEDDILASLIANEQNDSENNGTSSSTKPIVNEDDDDSVMKDAYDESDFIESLIKGSVPSRNQSMDIDGADDTETMEMSDENGENAQEFTSWQQIAPRLDDNGGMACLKTEYLQGMEYIHIMEVMTDYYIEDGENFIRIYGVTEHGNSVYCRISGFLPYMYIECPGGNYYSEKECSMIMDEINKMLVKKQEVADGVRWGRRGKYQRQQRNRTNDMNAKPKGPMPGGSLGAKNSMDEEDVDYLELEGDDTISPDTGSKRSLLDALVVSVECVQKVGVYGYKGELEKPIEKTQQYSDLNKSWFFKVTTKTPSSISTIRDFAEQHKIGVCGLDAQRLQTYESNILFELRYMIDRGLTGGCHMRIKVDKKQIAEYHSVENTNRHTNAQLYVETEWDQVDYMDPDKDVKWNAINELRVVSFDIECCNDDPTSFPKPYIENLPETKKTGQYYGGSPVTQIACLLFEFGSGKEDKPLANVLFMLNTRTPPEDPSCIVYSFDDEREMLLAWKKFMIHCDPDIFTGYNITYFDLPYLVKRSKRLRCHTEFSAIGRVKGEVSHPVAENFNSKALGTTKGECVNLSGRLQFDMLLVVKRDKKYDSYTLSNTSEMILGETKDDVHHTFIAPLFRGTDADRAVLGNYCTKDGLLPFLMLLKLMSLINYIEMARVVGVPLNYLLKKGQQIKVASLLTRHANREGIIIDVLIRDTIPDVSYEGATVLEPETGFYDLPVTTLDFASLYPSIMQALNLDYMTHLPKGHIRDTFVANHEKDVDYIITESGDYFVTCKVLMGILPAILTHLLAARKRANAAKAAAKEAGNLVLMAIMDGRQLAFKITANSVYGFTGTGVKGRLPCVYIGKSVTSTGRMMIAYTKNFVLQHYTIANGYKYDAIVIYGDTDSVMIIFGNRYVSECFELGAHASALITGFLQKMLGPSVKLEFEKVYGKYLLLAKKKYAGIMYMGPGSGGNGPYRYCKIDAKGIEMVRRDGVAITRKTQRAILTNVLKGKKEKGFEIGCKAAEKMRLGKVDISELVISKSLSHDPEDYDTITPHVAIALREQQDDYDNAPKDGDRISYVFIAPHTTRNSKKRDLAVRPLTAVREMIPLHHENYYEKTFREPLEKVLLPVYGEENVRYMFTGPHTRRRVQNLSTTENSVLRFARKIPTCFKCGCGIKHTEEELRERDTKEHNNYFKKKMEEYREMMGYSDMCDRGFERERYLVKIHESHYAKQNSCLCEGCETERSSLKSEWEGELKTLNREISDMKEKCVKCQGPERYARTECANEKCPIFFARYTKRQRREDIETKLVNMSIENAELSW